MANDVAALQVRLRADVANFQKGMDQATRRMKKMQADSRGLSNQFKSMQKSVGSLAKGFLAFAGVSASISSLKSAFEFGDSIQKTANAVGLGAEKLQEYQFAAARSGISTSQLTSNMTAFVKRMGELRNNTGPLNTALEKYDKTLVNTLKNSTSQEEAFGLIANAMQNAASATDQAFIANVAFGRSGVGMVNMLREGTAGLDAFGASARDAGVVISENLTKKAEVLNDRWDTLVSTIGNNFKAALITAADAALKAFGIFQSIEDVQAGIAEKTRQISEMEMRNLSGRSGKARKEQLARLQKERAELEAQLESMQKQEAALDRLKGAQDNFSESGKETADAQEKFADALERVLQASDPLIGKSATLAKQMTILQEAANKYPERALEFQGAQLKLIEQFNEGMKESSDALDDQTKFFDRYQKAAIQQGEVNRNYFEQLSFEVGSISEQIANSGSTMIMSFSQTVAASLAGARASFADFARSVIQEITAIMVNKAVLQFLGSFAGGPAGGALAGGFYDRFTRQAHGGVWSNGIQKFAAGGILGGPMLFPMARGAGLAGEAGPEAIMPLKRDAAGDLGIKMSVNVNNYSNESVSVQQEGGDLNITIGAMAGQIMKGGNPLSRAIESTYGISRARSAY